MNSKLEYGSIWLADLTPSHLSEPSQATPVLVFQHPFLLEAEHPSTIIIPLTTQLVEDVAPLRVRVTAQQGLEQDLDLLIDQIRVIDHQHLIKGPLACLSTTLMAKIQLSLQEVLGIFPQE